MKKNVRKLLALLLALAMVIALAACGSSSSSASSSSGSSGTTSTGGSSAENDSSSEDDNSSSSDGTVYTMRIGTLTVEAEQNTALALEFADRIAEETNGQIEVSVYPSAQLGTAAQMIEGMQNGTIEGGLFPTAYASSAAPMMNSLSVPGFAGTTANAMCAVINELGGLEMYNEYLKDAGLYMASLLNTDQCTYIITDSQITTIDDLSNLIIWSPPSDYTSYMVDLFGSSVTFFDTSDLAVAVQNGTVDSAMASPALFAAQKLYETLPYCMGLEGGAGATAFFMSESFLSSLPDDLRETVERVALECTMDYEYDYAAAAAETNLAAMAENGTVTYSSDYPDLQAALDEIYATVLQHFFDEVDGGEDFYNSVQELVAQYEG